MTMASGVATVAGSSPASPSRANQWTRLSDGRRPSSTMRSSGRRMSTRDDLAGLPGGCRARGDGLDALRTRPPRRASGLDRRRLCSRRSEEIVWRLFFTRWWISRMVASLEAGGGPGGTARRCRAAARRARHLSPFDQGMQRITTVMPAPLDPPR